ncbi:hypothetical protein NHQ30_010808 [Ciborinia camelliae]|nr:hypothetical protein NHQ30_010808 [Ciborinia camelliae]
MEPGWAALTKIGCTRKLYADRAEENGFSCSGCKRKWDRLEDKGHISPERPMSIDCIANIPKEGELTIVDLSCPCVTAEAASALFNLCLSLFLEEKSSIGKIVALDEAHKV